MWQGCYRIVSLGHLLFDCRSYCGLSCRMQGCLGQRQVKLYTLFRTARPKKYIPCPATRPRIAQIRECPQPRSQGVFPGLGGPGNELEYPPPLDNPLGSITIRFLSPRSLPQPDSQNGWDSSLGVRWEEDKQRLEIEATQPPCAGNVLARRALLPMQREGMIA